MTLLIIIIILAFAFDFINGFHDAANSIATIVATKVLTPFQAVLWAAFFNFVAYFISLQVGFKIGNSIAKTVRPDFITLEVILAGLIAAIAWNLLTWKLGIPSSSSHTLIGAFMGAAIMKAIVEGGANLSEIVNYGIAGIIILFIFMAPLIGMVIAYFVTIIILNVCKKANPSKADKWFKRLQLVSSAFFSIGHGTNDSQKVMGIIGAAVIYYHVHVEHLQRYITAADPFKVFVEHWWWVPITSFIMMGLGTMSGGWKIVKTMGTKITKVNSLEGVAAETAGAITLVITEHFGIPVSSTHTITGSIIGVGITKRISAVRWGITIRLLWAWVITIPISALLAAIIYYPLSLFI